MSEIIRYAFGHSSLGDFLAAASQTGLVAFEFGDRREALIDALRHRFAEASIAHDQAGLADAVETLAAVIDHPERGSGLALDMRGTEYQKQVWDILRAIPAGQTTGSISVLVNGDRLAEANEAFAVNLSNAVNAGIVDGQGVGTIVDDEPRISISDFTKAEGKKGQTTLFTFTVTLSAAYDQPVTVSYQTVNGTATTGDNHHVAKSGTLTSAPGETTKTITSKSRETARRRPMRPSTSTCSATAATRC